MSVLSIFVLSIILLLFATAVGVVIFSPPVCSVPQGKIYLIERFGKHNRTLKPGLHFLVPVVEKVVYKIDIREQTLDVASQEVITKDNAMVFIDGVVFFKVEDAVKACYEVSEYRGAVLHLVTANIRGTVGSMDLDQLLSKREELSHEILKEVHDATQKWGINVLRVQIQDIKPPEGLVAAMTKQLTAEREKRAAKIFAEGEKEAAIRRAEGEREASILLAQGEAEAEHLRSNAKKYADLCAAEARERTALAEARATTQMSKAISSGDVQAVNYFVAIQYIEALKALASADNQKVLMMPLDATNVIGSLKGINELSRAVYAAETVRSVNQQPVENTSTHSE
jgi:regulator of protease activity HflC (stomatin/prohibitin superfamily)